MRIPDEQFQWELKRRTAIYAELEAKRNRGWKPYVAPVATSMTMLEVVNWICDERREDW